ncbi:MAG: cytochrome c oxidase subunit II [Acidobacteriota bacterium]|nr:cytochrome c oxidase subunit II [Acidobacteriota bacterium]
MPDFLKNLPFMPEQASTMASQVDLLFLFILSVLVFFSSAIAITIIVFAVRYRRSTHRRAEQIEGSLALEIGWTVIPLGIALIMFVWGAVIFFGMNRPPAQSMEIYGVGKQWMWKFEHLDGQREINQLHVPVGRDVKVILASQDVIHSFYVPAFRIKSDVIPGRYSYAWFRATKVGRYHLFCAEYCGTMHSGMIGEVVVMEPADYEQWLAGGPTEGSLAQNGEKLFQQLACNTCHRADSGARGPNLVGLFGSTVTLQDGRKVIADENYVRESILNPQAKVVQGFQPIMPTFQGQVSEEGLLQLVEYVKAMKGQSAMPADNREPGAASPKEVNVPKAKVPKQ